MDIGMSEDGVYWVKNCSQVLTAADAKDLIQEHFDIEDIEEYTVIQATEEGDEQNTNYILMRISDFLGGTPKEK